MSEIEKRLHKVVPAMFDLFVTPLVSVFVAGYLALSIIGPVFVKLENGILDGVQYLIGLPFGIGSFVDKAYRENLFGVKDTINNIGEYITNSMDNVGQTISSTLNNLKFSFGW